MKRFRTLIAIAALAAAPMIASAQNSKSLDCNNDRNGDEPVFRAEDNLTIPFNGAALNIEAAKNGGVRVFGSDTNEFKVKVCKSVWKEDEQQAKSLLSQLKAVNEGGTLKVVGPEDEERWNVSLIIEAPKNAALHSTAVNGPMSFRDLTGAITAEVKNGPLSFHGVSGSVTAHVKNGPINFSGSSGDIDLEAKNGPLDIKLDGNEWKGKRLEASTTNGPVSLMLPANYNSGVTVDAEGWSPVECAVKGCEVVQRADEGHARHIQLGSGAALVHISTVNGPVSIRGHQAEY